MIRRNEVGIQMLSHKLHKQIFNSTPNIGSDIITLSKEHLQKHGLLGKTSPIVREPDFLLPPLVGNHISCHFKTIAKQQGDVYLQLANEMCNMKIPKMPTKWHFHPGWTRYNADGSFSIVSV